MSSVIRVGPGSKPPIIQQNQSSLGLSLQNEKIFNLVVGQIIPAIATGALISCIVFSFTINPLFIIGAVTSFVIGFLGVGAAYIDEPVVASAVEEVARIVTPRPPFEPNQPVGISNGGNNCWANAALQLILNNPGLEAWCAADPAFRNIFEQYRVAQRLGQCECGYLGRGARAVLHARNRNIDPGSNMEDPAPLFETMLGNIDQRMVDGRPLYQLQQSLNNGPFRPAPEPFIGIPMEDGVPFQNLFNSFFTYTMADGQQIRKVFPTAPQTLVVQLRRFAQHHNGDGTVENRKNNAQLAIPFAMNIAGNISLDGRAARYECTGFIRHLGTSVDGGHYISYVRRNGKWWLCDDSYVREATPEQVTEASRNSYMISYTKV